jgi:PilZ domain
MNEKKQIQRMGVRRYLAATERTSSLDVISFGDLQRTNYIARIVDLSVIGIGIEVDQPLQPGLVWLKDRVFGQKCGTLVWCKQYGTLYRAGIQFMHLTGLEEEYIRNQLELPKRCNPIRDPDGIIAALMQGINKDFNDPAY